MKFTDRFFSIPVRIYDRFSMKKTEEEEEQLNLPVEAKWTMGLHKVDYREIYSWGDYFDSEQGIDDVENGEGFLYTIISMIDGTTFISTLNKKDFEEKLNKYAEKYEKWTKEEEKKNMKESIELAKELDGSNAEVL